MKNIIRTFVLLLASASMLTAQQLDRSVRPEPGEARQPKIAQAEYFTLDNGVKVYVVENHKLPRVSISLSLNTEPIREGDKSGYISLAGDMLNQGTTTRTKAQLDEEVDFMGASLSAYSSGAYASGLSKYTDKLFSILSDVVFNPAWNEEEFEKLKTQELSGIENQKDDANAINSQVRTALMFGKENAFGEMVTEATINNISIDDCKAYYNSFFKPNIAYMAIVGDISLKDAKKYVEEYFGKWEKGDIPTMEEYTFPSYAAPHVAFVNRDASVQSVIAIGNRIELKPGHPDRAAVSVANKILGGGMSGRLFINLREDKAFTYGAYSSANGGKYTGVFNMGAEVRNNVTDSAIVEFFNELQKIRTTLPTDKEMVMAKALLSGDFGRSLESPNTVARFALNIDMDELPKDYYNTYLSRIEAVTKEDVQRVAKQYFGNENILICVTGKGSEVAESLKGFGTFQYYDMYADKTEAPTMPVPEGVTAESVVNKYLEVVGGAKKISKVKSYEMKMNMTMEGMPAPVEMVQAADLKKGYYYRSLKMNGMALEEVKFNGETGQKSGMQGGGPLEGEELEEIKAQAKYVVDEMAYLQEGYTLELSGAVKEGEAVLYIVDVTSPAGKKESQYYHAETGLKVKEVVTQSTPQGDMTITAELSEYKDFGGIMMPVKMVQKVGPQSMNFEMVYFNPKQKFNKAYLSE